MRELSLEVGSARKVSEMVGRQGQKVLIESEIPLDELSEQAWLEGWHVITECHSRAKIQAAILRQHSCLWYRCHNVTQDMTNHVSHQQDPISEVTLPLHNCSRSRYDTYTVIILFLYAQKNFLLKWIAEWIGQNRWMDYKSQQGHTFGTLIVYKVKGRCGPCIFVKPPCICTPSFIPFLQLSHTSVMQDQQCIMRKKYNLENVIVWSVRFYSPVVSDVYMSVFFSSLFVLLFLRPCSPCWLMPTPVGTSVGGYLTEPAPGS